MRFQPERQKRFVDLAFVDAFVGEEQIFRQLLRYGRAALNDAAGLGIGYKGAEYALNVDAEMLIEPAIFGRQHRLDELIWKVLERYRFGVLDAAAADLVAVAVKKRHRQIGFLQPIVIGSLTKRRDRQGQQQKECAGTE